MTVFSNPQLLNASRWSSMRVGMLGGSFNPPHKGHVHISQMALKALKLDAVWWLVTPHNPMKDKDTLLPVEQRLELCQKLITHPQIVVSDIEAKINPPHSFATVKTLKKHFPHTHFAWITGMDNAHNFHHWNHWKAFLNNMCMIHVTRHPPVKLIKTCPVRMRATQKHVIVDHGARYPLDSNTTYWLLQKKMINISSTEIRQKNSLYSTP